MSHLPNIDYNRTTAVHAGGITHLRRIADLAALYQVRMPHNEQTDAVFPPAYTFKDVFMQPDKQPGHGVKIDQALAAKYLCQRAYLPVNRLQRDGPLRDW